MQSVRPNEAYPIIRILPDTLDNEVHFVQAKIRRIDGTVFDTVNLDDLGNRVFTKLWQAPGQKNFHFIITTTIFSDSSYSTVNTNYYTESTHGVVEDRPGWFPTLGGGGGSIDYKKLKQIIRET